MPRHGASLGQYNSHRQETIMRRIIATTFVSLDGIMQAPGGPTEDPTGGFPFGG